MQELTKNEMRKTTGGIWLMPVIDWGVKMYAKLKLINKANYPIGPIENG